MARGFKTGGRQKGSKNKQTLLLEERTRALIDNAKEIIGGDLFQGDAHAFMISIYKDKSLPLNLRLDAAKHAIRYEKPAMTAVDAHSKTESSPLCYQRQADDTGRMGAEIRRATVAEINDVRSATCRERADSSMAALRSKADMPIALRNVRLRAKADIRL